MSVVSLLGVKILNNPAPFTASYQFEITFECLEQLQKGEPSKSKSVCRFWKF
jgi:histone chaperone ASF1